jgi:hypothetical protein
MAACISLPEGKSSPMLIVALPPSVAAVMALAGSPLPAAA